MPKFEQNRWPSLHPSENVKWNLPYAKIVNSNRIFAINVHEFITNITRNLASWNRVITFSESQRSLACSNGTRLFFPMCILNPYLWQFLHATRVCATMRLIIFHSVYNTRHYVYTSCHIQYASNSYVLYSSCRAVISRIAA